MCRMPVVSLRAKVILPRLNYRMLGWATEMCTVLRVCHGFNMDRGTIPSHIWLRRKKGVWHKVHKVWYVFVSFTDCIRPTFPYITSRKVRVEKYAIGKYFFELTKSYEVLLGFVVLRNFFLFQQKSSQSTLPKYFCKKVKKKSRKQRKQRK